MSDVTQILAAVDQGDPRAAEQLLPLVYDELRRLAGAKLGHEKAGQTLQPTALVHEAYLRLVGPGQDRQWENRRHFFSAAAEAMRRILVEAARRKHRLKHGGDRIRVSDEIDIPSTESPDRLIALDQALDRLGNESSEAAELVKLRYFAGFTNSEAAALLDISPRKGNQVWAYARAWLREEIGDDGSE